MSTEPGVGPSSAARSSKGFSEEAIIKFWKSTPSFTELGKLLCVSRYRAWNIVQKIGERHPNEEMPGRPWSRLKTSEKIVKSINDFFGEPMQPEKEAAFLRVWEGISSEKKAEIKKTFKKLIAAGNTEGVTNYLDSIAMPPPAVPPPRKREKVSVTGGSVIVQEDPNASESDLSESETEEGGKSGAS
jgi:hypothetical protein